MIPIFSVGHGGVIGGEYQTKGKRSPNFGKGVLYEGMFNRWVVNRIIEQLDRLNIPYYHVVPEYIDISLSEKVLRANRIFNKNNNTYLIEFHANGGGGVGIEGFTSIGQNKSDAVAEVFLKNYKNDIQYQILRTDLKDGDLDKESNFYIFKSKCPAVLLEMGFMDNQKDYDLLWSESYLNDIVKSSVRSIQELYTQEKEEAQNNNQKPMSEKYNVRLPFFEVKPTPIKTLSGSEYLKLHDLLGIQKLHDNGLTGKGIKIGIIDTGTTFGHPDLKPPVLNFDATDDEFSNDNDGHGTHVYGTMAMQNNSLGSIGICPDADFYVAKGLNKDGMGLSSWILECAKVLVSEKVDIVNMSLGLNVYDKTLEQAIVLMQQNGIIVIAASGNESLDICSYPSNFKDVLSVGAIDYDNQVANFSNTCESMDLVTYGVDIVSTWIDGTYRALSGTSMATAVQTGITALLLQKMKELEINVNVQSVLEVISKNKIHGYDYLTSVQILELIKKIEDNTGIDDVPNKPQNTLLEKLLMLIFRLLGL